MKHATSSSPLSRPGVAAWLCAFAALSAAPAWADDRITLTGLGVQAQIDIQTWPAAHAPTDRSARFDAAAASEIDTRLWLRRSGRPVSVGFGAVTSEGSANGPFHGLGTRPSSASSLVFGLRYDFANGSRLTLGSTAGSPASSDGAAPERDVRLDLKPARSGKRFSRGTLFRAQLAQGTQLSLRVRSGGLRLVLRSEF